jgi:hypothetical protein
LDSDENGLGDTATAALQIEEIGVKERDLAREGIGTGVWRDRHGDLEGDLESDLTVPRLGSRVNIIYHITAN